MTKTPYHKIGIQGGGRVGDDDDDKEYAVVEESLSVAHRELPAVPQQRKDIQGTMKKKDGDTNEDDDDEGGGGTLLLFYQYQEPPWNGKEHKKALKEFINLCKQHNITGRGRVAPEGFNCTLTGLSQDIRSLCYALREWMDIFQSTDFKFTDHMPLNKLFKSLSVRKVQELVAYGLEGAKAPSLEKFAGTHLTATEYHEVLKDPSAVVIDVRNSYETAIGNIQPPPGGATFIDPNMRHSMEFKKWLSQKETQEQLQDKKVLMYCTGGIRCERATALLNQMQAVGQVSTKGVYEIQGGIDRYLKTFPKGGFWKGKNYLFDRRMEQIPSQKDLKEVENEINSVCCVCLKKWTMYRGKYFCKPCGVPVIVCQTCTKPAKENPQDLCCDLCRKGLAAPKQHQQQDLIGQKRKAEAMTNETHKDQKKTTTTSSLASSSSNNKVEKEVSSDRLFISKLPLTTTKSKLQKQLLGSGKNGTSGSSIKVLHWLTDRQTGAFYGSCMVQLDSIATAKYIMETMLPMKVDKKRIKVTYAKIEGSSPPGKTTTSWPPASLCDKEFPPIGT